MISVGCRGGQDRPAGLIGPNDPAIAGTDTPDDAVHCADHHKSAYPCGGCNDGSMKLLAPEQAP